MPMNKQGCTAWCESTLWRSSPIWAHPAFTRDGMLIKDAETLSFWDVLR